MNVEKMMQMLDDLAMRVVLMRRGQRELGEKEIFDSLTEVMVAVMTSGDRDLLDRFQEETSKMQEVFEIIKNMGRDPEEVRREQMVLAFEERNEMEFNESITDPIVRPYMYYMEMQTCRAIH